MKWFRVYNEIIDDPKIAKISCAEFKLFINLMAVCSERDNGATIISTISELCWRLRTQKKKTHEALLHLQEIGLIKYENDRLTLINWDKRQFSSDNVNKRSQRFREQKRNVARNVAGNGESINTDSEQIQIQNRTEEKKIKKATQTRPIPRSGFQPPSLEEVKQLFINRKYFDSITEAEKFHEYYTANGWRIGRYKMKCWQSAAGKWNRNAEQWAAEREARGGSRRPSNLPDDLTTIDNFDDKGNWIGGKAS